MGRWSGEKGERKGNSKEWEDTGRKDTEKQGRKGKGRETGAAVMGRTGGPTDFQKLDALEGFDGNHSLA